MIFMKTQKHTGFTGGEQAEVQTKRISPKRQTNLKRTGAKNPKSRKQRGKNNSDTKAHMIAQRTVKERGEHADLNKQGREVRFIADQISR